MRWFFLLAALFNAALALALVVASDANVFVSCLGAIATLYLCWRWKRGYERKSFSIASDFLAGGALILVGYGAGDPIRAGMLIYVGLFLQALTGTRRRVVFAAAVHVSAYVIAVLLSPTLPTLNLWSPEVLLQPPGVMMTAIMYVLGNTLARHERASAREQALARAGSELVASGDRDSVYAAALEAVMAITSPHVIGAIPFLAFGENGRLGVIGAAGIPAPIEEKLRGMFLDLDQIPCARERLMKRQSYDFKPSATADAAAGLGFGGRPGSTVFAMPLFSGDDLCGVLAVITQASLPDECKDSLRALATEVALGLGNLKLREELAHQAFHDPLTHLANRALLTDRLQHALTRTARSQAPVALLLLDVDGFKTVNDSLGHLAGDQVLCEVATRLRGCLRESDTAARLGGDEFAVLVEEIDHDAADPGVTVESARSVARRILDALSAPIYLSSTEVFVSASIGIAIGSAADSVEELLSQADAAMYAAKRSGKSRYNVFEPQLRAEVLHRLALETDLRRALEAGQFGLQYQPIVELRTGRHVAFEALVRWEHPRRGVIGPEQFLSLAEDTGQVVALGRWVLAEACRQAWTWRAMNPRHAALAINVNVAARQLREPGFVDDVVAALTQSGLPADGLVLELTEAAFIQRSVEIVARLEQLRRLGVHLSLDDFGTGNSSLAYLRDLPFDSVKIDRSFVEGIERNPTQTALMRAIVSLTSALQLTTVAEGVESAAQARRLARLGCDLGQGFHFAKPLEAADVAQVLAEATPARAA